VIKRAQMLRRLSDVTIGSIEKILNIGSGGVREKEVINSEKKRKFKVSVSEYEEDNDEDNFADKEVHNKILRKFA
jgi:hypothetical protein